MADDAQIRDILRRLERLEAVAPETGAAPTSGEVGEAGSEDPAGALRFAGSVQIGRRRFQAKQVFKVAQVFEADPEIVARMFAALGSAFRVRLLRALLEGPRSSQELQGELEIGPVGQLYHHLKELLAAGLIVQPQRSIYAIRDVMVMPICMALAVAASSPADAPVIKAAPGGSETLQADRAATANRNRS